MRVSPARCWQLGLPSRMDHATKQSGLPRIASPELGRRILDLMRELSAPFGTDIRIEGNVGVIRPLT